MFIKQIVHSSILIGMSPFNVSDSVHKRVVYTIAIRGKVSLRSLMLQLMELVPVFRSVPTDSEVTEIVTFSSFFR